MRTKHILTALALPALFAACTADEFVNEDFGKTAERAKVSKNFSLITSEDATTRYAVDGETSLKFLFEKGDKIGAAIIDEMDPNEEDPKDWTIIPSLAGNYPFEYDGSQWNSATTLGIGHYLFVYPYDKSDNNRAAVSYSLPTVQKLYKGENGALDLNAAIEEGDKAVFSSVLYEGDTQLAAKLQGLYTYPKFVINFDNGLPITSVSQVVLEYSNGDGFEVKGGFNHQKVADTFAGAEAAEDEKAYWDGKQTADFLIKDGEIINSKDATQYTTREYSKYLIAKLPDNTPVKVNSITNNKYIEVRFMMPGVGAGAAGKTAYGDNLKMHIYTNNGIYTIADVWAGIQWKSTTSDDAKSKALLRGHSNTMTLSKDAPEVGSALTIVTSIADWNSLVDAYGATANQTISIVGDEFFFDSTVKMPSKAVFTVNTPVSVKGDVTLKNIKATDDITVEKGAKLTTSSNFTATKVVNKGAMVLAQALDSENEVVNYNGVSEIENQGTLAVAKDAVATFILTNAKAAIVENDGTMTISGENEGVINNNAVMNTTGFTNNAREYNTKGDKIVNEPTINNAKGAKILSASGALTNNATIINAGVLTCKNSSGTITNGKDEKNVPAVLDSKTDAITYITDNAEGKVIVYSANTEGLTIANAKGVVEYTTANAAESFKTSLVNTVIAAKSLEVKDGALSSLTFDGDATLKLGKDATVSVLTVNNGKTTLATDLALETLNVAQGAMVVIPEGKAMTINGNEIDNKGTILVGGTFNATQIEAGKGGLVEDNGNGEINWAATPADVAEKSYKEKVKVMMQAWILESNSWINVEDYQSGNWESSGNSGLDKTWNELTTEAKDKYNAWQKALDSKFTNKTIDEYIDIFKADEDGIAAAVIAEYKAYGNSNRGSVIKKEIANNSWIETSVYVKAASTTKFDAIAINSGSTLVADFVEKIKEITNVDFSTNSDATLKKVENKAITLSIAAVEAKDVVENWVPAFSYIGTYKGAAEYDVMYALKNSGFGEWFTNEANTLTTIAGVKAAVAKVYDAYNNSAAPMGILEKTKVEKSGILDHVTEVLDWDYTDEQIDALNTAATPD